jgi:uncharacterized membrane protein (UPF0127 family)
MKTLKLALALAVLGSFVACGTERPAQPGKDPGFVKIAGGVLSVEFARTDEQRAMGLMFRDFLATNAGMVFVFDPPSTPAFYMKNTRVPLDILFVDGTMTVVDIQQMEPFDEKDLHRPPSAVRYAIEANRGWSALHGVKVGDRAGFVESDR